MDIRGGRPRDAKREVKQPKCRVSFHDAKGAADEYEGAGADVPDGFAWTEARRRDRDRTFVLYSCVPQEKLGLLRLVGHDPNER